MDRRLWATLGVASAFALASAGPALADGDETLGEPSIAIAEGTGVAAGGVGMLGSGSGTVNVEVPAGATVSQVLLYWQGHFSEGNAGDDTAIVDGTEVTGTALSSAPQPFFQSGGAQVFAAGYRADITELGLVSEGANAVEVSGLEFALGDNNVTNGAGILVIYDDGSETSFELRDGVDTAFADFPSPRDTTVPQTFTFESASVDRTMTFTAFAASVFDTGVRPNALLITAGDEEVTVDNPFSSANGGEWDTYQTTIEVPAGVGEITIQALSVTDDEGHRPASLVWIAGALSVAPEAPPPTTTSTTAEPTTTTSTTVAPTTSSAPPSSDTVPTTVAPVTTTPPTTAPGGNLPETGSNSTIPLVLGGLALVLIGGGVLLVVRRMRASRPAV